jgi:hypothetical protein
VFGQDTIKGKRSEDLSTMSQEELLLERWRELPPEYQSELLTFANFLHTKVVTYQSRPNIKGLCLDTHSDLTLEDFTQARREAWANFPREEFYS